MTLLSVQEITKVFRIDQRTSKTAVSKLEFELDHGEILAFIGLNGAGKTTTIKIIATLIQPDSGRVLIAGEDPQLKPDCLNSVGAILEGNRNVYWRLTPLENIEYFAGLRGISRINARKAGIKLLERFGLGDRVDSVVSRLSRGMQQKLAIVVALMHRPALLLLDEPTLGLDFESTQDMKSIIRELSQEGIGVLLTTHQLSLAESMAHSILVLHHGEKVLRSVLSDALQKANHRRHTVVLLHLPSEDQRMSLLGLGASVDHLTVTFLGDSSQLYSVMSVLRPLEIDTIRTSTQTLDDLFMEIARSGRKIA